MSFDPLSPLASSAPLIVYIDYKSPYAYLAIEPTYALQDELGIEIDWRPFTLDIPSYLGSAKLNHEGKVVDEARTQGQWTRVKYAYHDVRRYGSLRGIIVRGTHKIWDSSLAGIGMLWAREQGRAILRAYSGLVYERFWKRELDIEDIGVIERILSEAGASIAGFQGYAGGEGRVFHDSIQHNAFDAGIFGVPTYVIGSQVFFGREHLARIRWMLAGRIGAPPDIANPDRPNERAAGEFPKGRLPVAIDFNSPNAYLAIRPTCALADDFKIAIDWEPLVVAVSKTTAPPSSEDDRGTRHRRIRADYLERDVIRYAADRGLSLRALSKRKDSTLAALSLLWVKGQSPSLARQHVEQVFDRYWQGSLDIENEQSLLALMAEIGVPGAGFEEFAKREGREELARVQSKLRDRGVFEVPAYLANDDIFIGRQHLPLIRWRLAAERT